jgi:hypothetical protein
MRLLRAAAAADDGDLRACPNGLVSFGIKERRHTRHCERSEAIQGHKF